MAAASTSSASSRSANAFRTFFGWLLNKLQRASKGFTTGLFTVIVSMSLLFSSNFRTSASCLQQTQRFAEHQLFSTKLTLISLISKCLRKKTARAKAPTTFYQSSLPRKRLRDASIYTSKKYRSSSILERYFFVSIYPAASHGTCLAVFLVAVLLLC